MVVNQRRAESKARSLAYYEQYIERLNNPKKSIYIVQGQPYWRKFITDSLNTGLGKKPTFIDSNLKLFMSKLRYRTLGRNKHFYHFIYTGDSMSSADFEAFRDYLKKPSKHGVLIVEVADWKAQRTFNRYFDFLKNTPEIEIINSNFYRPSFKEMHVRSLLDNRSIQFENTKIKAIALKNLQQNFDDLLENISTLDLIKDEDNVVSTNDYYQSIEQYGDLTRTKMYDSLSKVNRKKVPYEVVHELLENGDSPSYILRGIQKHFTLLYQAKYLKMRGILRKDDIESEKMFLYTNGPVKFPEDTNIWELKQPLRNRLLDDCEEFTLNELIQSLLIIENSFTTTRTERDGQVDYSKYTSKEQLMMCVISIMNRRIPVP